MDGEKRQIYLLEEERIEFIKKCYSEINSMLNRMKDLIEEMEKVLEEGWKYDRRSSKFNCTLSKSVLEILERMKDLK
jgi:hypothetical protein